MIQEGLGVFLFDDIRVESGTFRAFKAGEALQLEPKTLRLLIFLIENRRRLVEKAEILATIWSGTNVTENALTREIAKLRKTLGDDPKTPRYIQTVHTRGYRFIAELYAENGKGTAELAGLAETTPAAESESIADARSLLPGQSLFSIPYARAIAIVGVLGLCLVAGILFWKQQRQSKQTPAVVVTTSLAVLPFKTSGAGASDEYLGVEIADALTSRLSNSKRLSVRPITSVLHYANTGSNSGQDPKTIGNLLKVDYVLYGEIDRARQNMKTNLIRVRDGASLLAENYDDKFGDIFQLEDSLCAKVLANLLVTLDHEETQRLRRRYTQDQQAYETFLKAHYFMNKATREDANKGIDFFRQAIDLDPKYAMAYAGLSDCYMRLGRFGLAPAEFVPQSRAAVMKSLELDDTVAYAHSMLGRLAFQYDWDFPRAEREYARARELEPSLVHAWYGGYLLALNRVAEAEVEYRKFEDFLPFMPASTGLGHYFYLTRQYDSAVDLLTRKVEMNPNYPASHEWLGLVFEQQGRDRQAIEEFQKAITLSGGDFGVGALGHLYAKSGRKDEARKAIQRLDERARVSYVSPYEKAVIYAGLDQQDESLKYLQKSFDERSLSASLLRFDPRLNELRADPRFQDLMRRVGMTP
jgi:DNA-binding winged helix-turn-helix (wHTH) protein/tetratricopeptide (TPR) repeat protein